MTVPEIAKITKCTKRHIQEACKKMGVKKTISEDGYNLHYDLTPAQVKELIAHLHFKRGRPRNTG
jgi:hypothetical protein